MPELPEVESSVAYLKNKVLKRTFIKFWTNTPKMGVTKGALSEEFEELLKKRKIEQIKRRAKNVIIVLDNDLSLLIHYKMTGHLLVGQWERQDGKWIAKEDGPLKNDKMNQYIRCIFFLDDGQQIAFSDLRKFGKVELWKTKELEDKLSKLGPEPLSEDFTLNQFEDILHGRRKMIKPLIMEQSSISGVGNIYASEALWMAGIHPETKANQLEANQVKKLYKAIRKVLQEGLESQGDSMSDFRLPDGTKGNYQNKQKVYAREGESCLRCKATIEKIKVGGRGTYLCPNCQ